MSEPGGRWVDFRRPDGSVRTDWRPDDQPASPDGRSGSWHVVTGEGFDRWEWVPTDAAVPLPTPSNARLSEVVSPPVGSARSRSPRVMVLALVIALVGVAGGAWAWRSTSGPEGPVLDPVMAYTQRLEQEVTVDIGAFETGTDPATGAAMSRLPVTFTNNSAGPIPLKATVHATDQQGAPLASEAADGIWLDVGESVRRDVFTGASPEQVNALAGASFSVALQPSSQ